MEGFLQARQGAGTFVANVAAVELPPIISEDRKTQPLRRQMISKRIRDISASKVMTHLGSIKAFRPGIPALDQFPRRAWAAAHSKVMRNDEAELLGYGPVEGLHDLKRAITFHVRDHRGIQCDPEQIVITSGAQQAFVLIALTQLERCDNLWFEDPGHIAARDAFRLLGVGVKSVPIDEEGLDFRYAMRRHNKAQAIFVTPSHQHPLGVTMSLKRRLELLDHAQQNSCLIVEDDYDSEFHYDDRALPALQALDHSGLVLYVGSFSKSLFPSIRLGYVICPKDLVDAFNSVQILLSQNVSRLQQQVLARFMLDGSFSAHIRKMRTVYRQRRDMLINSLEQIATDLFELEPCRAGMHLICWLREPLRDEMDAARLIWKSGVDCLPISIYCDEQKVRPGIVLGFACVPEHEIERNVRMMTRALIRRI